MVTATRNLLLTQHVLSRHKHGWKRDENRDLKIAALKIPHRKVIKEGILNNNNYNFSVRGLNCVPPKFTC